MPRIRTTDEITIANTAGTSRQGQGFAAKFAAVTTRLEAVKRELEIIAGIEVERRIAFLNRRFPRHHFEFISGNGVFYVYVRTPRGEGMRYSDAQGFFGDFALRAEEQFKDSPDYLAVRARPLFAKTLATLWDEVEAINAIAIEFEDATGWAL